MRLIYARQALRDLRALPATDRLRIVERLDAYAAEPEAPQHNVTPLVGTAGGFRLRSGDWRALFTISGDEMTVFRIGHRREVYR